ncbi:MAG: class I SAM-dependent DNA methyltransferase [Acidimicrobiaceae bacterium]|nr:class I SAM-dependent DNA methyltransferase [Acidimicrobiaceae bacterium]
MSQGSDDGPAAFIWSMADLLRGSYKKSEYGQVILPFTVLRRLDCLLASTSGDSGGDEGDDAAGAQPIRNLSGLSLAQVLEDSSEARISLEAYIDGFGSDIRSVFNGFGFLDEVDRLQRTRLFDVVGQRFLELDLGAATATHDEMSHLFEELVRRFADLSNETRGEHVTPRDLVELVARLLVQGEHPRSVTEGADISVFDPTCGTGGLLAATEDLLQANTDDLGVHLYGQELNQQTWAICRADMALRGHGATNILLGDSLADDGQALGKFDYIVANPPFGMGWQQVRDVVDDEHRTRGFAGRFGAGIPRLNDSSFLFLQHMISKMKPPEEGGSRLAVILNGSPLFTGTAQSGESKIRRWIIENDLLDAVVALPDQLLFSTRIPIFVWLLSNRKPEDRQGTVQLVDARESFARIRRNLGSKQKQITSDQAEEILRQVRDHDRDGRSRVLPNAEFVDPESGRCAIEPWMFMAEVDRETHRPLHEFVESCREVVLESAAPLLRMEDLESRTPKAVSLTERAEVGARHVICMGGDIVGDAHTWRVLPSDFGSAATHLTVLRLGDGIRSNALLLSRWLASPDCLRQQTASVVRRLNRQTMVPVELVTDDALATAMADLIEARDESLRQIDRLFPDPFEDASLQDLVPSSLRTEALKARAVQSLLRPLDDVVQRAELQGSSRFSVE